MLTIEAFNFFTVNVYAAIFHLLKKMFADFFVTIVTINIFSGKLVFSILTVYKPHLGVM